MSDYDRFGGRTPGDFLAKWTDTKTGYFNYPPQDGFQLDVDGKPIKGKMMLAVGTEVDRFGSEYGKNVPVNSRRHSPVPGLLGVVTGRVLRFTGTQANSYQKPIHHMISVLCHLQILIRRQTLRTTRTTIMFILSTRLFLSLVDLSLHGLDSQALERSSTPATRVTYCS